MSIKFIQLPTCKLAEFVSSGATSFDVSGFLYNDGVTPVDPADIGDVCFATLEPKTAREELISFTIDSVTAGGVATITATRGLSQKSPYDTGGAAFDHQNGTDLVISNNPGLFNKLAAKANDETITGSWQFPAPSHVNNPATKTYVDTGLTAAVDALETLIGDEDAILQSQIDALDDEAVKLTGDQTIAGVKTFSSSPVVPSASTSGQAVNKGQMETYIAANSGDIKASDTAFGTVKLDVPADNVAEPIVLTATEDRVTAMEGIANPPSTTNPFVTSDDLSDPTIKAPQVVKFTSSGTWTKDPGLKYIIVEAVGGGGGGSGFDTDSTGGIANSGGGGGYCKKLILASALSATETVTIGALGAGGISAASPNAGSNGGNTTFGSHLTAGGGLGGTLTSGTNIPGEGGTATGGDINIPGGGGTKSSNESYGGTRGGNSILGIGAHRWDTDLTDLSPGSGYGFGGAGGWDSPDADGSNGGVGIVIVTEYYS